LLRGDVRGADLSLSIHFLEGISTIFDIKDLVKVNYTHQHRLKLQILSDGYYRRHRRVRESEL